MRAVIDRDPQQHGTVELAQLGNAEHRPTPQAPASSGSAPAHLEAGSRSPLPGASAVSL
jgi:hypothetical protein